MTVLSDRNAPCSRSAWVPPATALLVGCVVALFVPLGIGVLIATVLPTCALAVALGLLVAVTLRRRQPGRGVEIALFTTAWLVSSVLVTVLARLVLQATGISVTREPFIQGVLLDLLTTAPVNALLIVAMIGATVVVTRRPSKNSTDVQLE